MKCPTCVDSDLLMSERQGVEIDYCPKCRGVWLDRGELDKLIERSSTSSVALSATQPVSQPNYPPNGYTRNEEHHSSNHDGYGREQHRKKSWLSEIFD